MVTIFLPVSRTQFLRPVFESLEMMECDRTKTNLFVIVDGDAQLFVEARNFVQNSKFEQKLAVQWKSKHNKRHYDIMGRRMRIADLHNYSKEFLQEADYIMGVEDDTIVPPGALKKMLAHYGMYPYAGFIQGVQLGRWGIPYVGAWKVDDIYEPKAIESLPKGKGLQEIDAGGLYCYLTKYDHFIQHEYKPFERNAMGPDVDFGISMRKLGLINYIDWSIDTGHMTRDKTIRLFQTEERVVRFEKNELGRWRQSTLK